MNNIFSRGDLTAEEMGSLREVVDHSFMSRASMPLGRRARLVALGLIQNGMGGVMPTPAGRIVARM